MAFFTRLFATGWKTLVGMLIVIIGEGIKIVFPSYSAIGDIIVQIGAGLGAVGLTHRVVKSA